jgi:hypothetical protein
VEDSLARNRLDRAREALSQLEEWAGEESITFESAAAVAAAAGDPSAELAALRALTGGGQEGRDLLERRADLELEVGDAGAGLRIVQDLVAANPGDAALEEKLARARFFWRLQLLPVETSQLIQQTELTRGDFAAILYWLFPEVRYGRAGEARIANDVLDHAHREEIVRVANLGLMDVDTSLHRFEPDRPVTRSEVLASLTRLLARRQPPLSCLGSGPVGQSSGWICEAAAQCRLLDEPADCLPGASVSGKEAVELGRRTLELLGIQQ